MMRTVIAMVMLGAMAASGPAAAQDASSQTYLSAILHGSPAQRAAEARDRNAARRSDGGSAKDKPKGRRRGGMPGMGQ